jgi:DNA-binding CsgD family transcriptional regulator
MTRHRVGDFDGMRAAAATIDAVALRSDPHQSFAAEYFAGLVSLMEGDRRGGLARVTAAIDLLASEPELRDDPHYLVPLVFAAAWTEITPELAGLVEAGLTNARSKGALAALLPALTMTAFGRSWLGDNDGAFADASEAAELAEELGFVDAAPAFEMLAWQYASRGDHDVSAGHLERAAALVERAGTAAVATHLALTRAYCAICRDDVGAVVAILEPWMEVDGGRGAQGEILGVAPLLIEGYAGLGDLDAAVGLADRYGDQPDPDGRTVALAERCHGLATADDDTAILRFEAALRAHAAVSDAPFETARTQLLLGSRLRRTGRRAAARDHLRSARETFAAMGLTLWVDRCTAELGSAGETVRFGEEGRTESLTPQETRVAQMVCRGMTNAEVAAALFVSPKTVEHHLSSIYRKRGVRSRTELTAQMTG